jgi:predicted flap endonuclease-1-like 5' DNA nuclease
MKNLKSPSTFGIGLVFGTLVGLLVWYWYKSTSAEDGALDLLDKMAVADAKIHDLESKLHVESVETYITLEPTSEALPPFLATEPSPALDTAKPSEELQKVKGIGPIFAQKLQVVGIDTVVELTAVSTQKLAEILEISQGRATAILLEAQRIQ